MSSITLDDLNEKDKDKIYVQDYSEKPQIEGVKIVEVKNFISEDGDFTEILRFSNGEVEGFEGFKVSQINRTKIIPGSVKAWHLHYKQDEIWHVLPDKTLLVGLWDLRKNSSTADLSMRVALGGGKSQLLFIPKGVAHGCSNLGQTDATILYFMSEKFDQALPDEQRLDWDTLGKEFWEAKKG